MTRGGGPKHLWQIAISDDPGSIERSRYLQTNARSLREVFPEASYRLLKNEEVRAMVAADFGAEVVAAYDTLAPYSYKSDLARFCLMYEHGGLYADLSMRFLSGMALPDQKKLFCFRDAFNAASTPWAVSTGVLLAEPGLPEFAKAIELLVANVAARVYGSSPLHPTGPELLGRALAIVDEGGRMELGEFKRLTPGPSLLSFGYSDRQGRLIAIRQKDSGENLGLGDLAGLNSYSELWSQRRAYGEPLSIDIKAADRRLATVHPRSEDDRIFVTPAMAGILTYGPYIPLNPGRFKAVYALRGPFLCGQALSMEVALDGAVVASRAVRTVDEATLDFEVSDTSATVEVRLVSGGAASGEVSGLLIEAR